MLANNQRLQAQRHKPALLWLPLLLAVAALPTHAAGKDPVCKILTPKSKAKLAANQDISFSAKATLKDANAGPLTYEWDFGGGSMGELIPNSAPPAYQRPTSLNTSVQFVRNNATYRVHFSAMDKNKRRCDASIDVVVGTPPAGLPNISAMVRDAQKNAPKLGNELGGNEGDLVVLPYPDLTMQAHTDARYNPYLEIPVAPGSFNSLNALVYEKARKPKKVGDDSVTLRYQAASSKTDPVGAASINSTSQNWPGAAKNLTAPFDNALIQKTDMWNRVVECTYDKPDCMDMNWMDDMPGGMKVADQGFTNGGGAADSSYMPGYENPFVNNDFKDFKAYNAISHEFTANNIPLTDIDDTGKINPYPLMRVQAFDSKTHKPVAGATTDAVVSAAKDFHCSECHAKGKIAAPDKSKVDFSQLTNAFRSSSEYFPGYHCRPSPEDDCSADALKNGPGFYDSVDKNGNHSEALADKEFAAIRNILALHDFYDNIGMNWFMEKNAKNPNGGMADFCTWCHSDMLETQIGWGFNNNIGKNSGDMMYYPDLSMAIHKFHGKLQLDPGDKSKILRKSDGRPLLWNDAQGANPNSLFPTVDNNGKSLPMEQSCLRCHSGHREQLYRDRMFTAGVTCFDCHGDMAAVGQVHDKPKPGPEGKTARVPWLDQPDCGACHMGDGNVGKNSPEAFSAGVMKRAFDIHDKSATSRAPLTQRFAVQTTEPQQISEGFWVDPEYSQRHTTLTLSKSLYRNSRDTHGDVACAACHGGAHEVWANRDPKANDNVTSLQLQGHTGTILECNVCHTANSFKDEKDLDGGTFMTDVDIDSGVLGGPHNLHPINDPYWWQSSQNGRDSNSDGSLLGGWHNNYAKKPGKNGEDQCAACHGNDHKGTRLSKTPVDRVFTFKGDKQKLLAAGFRNTTVKVAAGSVIGCDTCHSIETSCKGSPAGSQCGVASTNVAGSGNHDPVISSTPALTAVMGDDYSYQIVASDADGDGLLYSLGSKPAPVRTDGDPDNNWTDQLITDKTISINPSGLLTVNWDQGLFAHYKKGPFKFPFSINVSDGKGGYAVQNVEVTLQCPAGTSWKWTYGKLAWMWGNGSCVANSAVSITSTPSVTGISSGEVYSYDVNATDSSNRLPIKYSIVQWPDGSSNWNAPHGIEIDENSGQISWTAKPSTYGETYFIVKATNADGVSDTQLVTITTCVPTKQWDAGSSQCIAK